MAMVEDAEGLYDMLPSVLENIQRGGRKVMVLPVSLLGLANRLRIVACFVSIALRLHAHLIVPWFQDSACNASFESLFSLAPDVTTFVTFVDVQTKSPPDSDLNMRLQSLLQLYSLNHSSSSWSFLAPQKFQLSEADFRGDILLLRTRGMHVLDSDDCHTFLEAKTYFYQRLLPHPSIQQVIDTVKDQYFSQQSDLVGVHIRAFDWNHDWAMVGPSPFSSSNSNNSAALRFDEASPYESFLALLRQILIKAPTTRFFVASNALTVKQLLLRDLGDSHVITLLPPENNDDRSSWQALQLAVVEWYLLGETRIVLHSRASSFAREAAARTRLSVVDVMSYPYGSSDSLNGNCADDRKSVQGHCLDGDGGDRAGGEERRYLAFVSSVHRSPSSDPHASVIDADADRIGMQDRKYRMPDMAQCALPEYLRLKAQSDGHSVDVGMELSETEEVEGGRSRDNRDGREAEVVCYEETGGRDMCSRVYRVCPCGVLAVNDADDDEHVQDEQGGDGDDDDEDRNNGRLGVDNMAHDRSVDIMAMTVNDLRRSSARRRDRGRSWMSLLHCPSHPVPQKPKDDRVTHDHNDEEHNCVELVAESHGYSIA